MRSLNDPLSPPGTSISELDLRPAAEPLLSRAVIHFQREPERVQTGVHRFVEDRRRDLCIGEVRVHRERQLRQTRALLVEVCSPAREALYHDIGEISLEMPEVVGYVALNEG